mmetsp:Transcript_5801/g.7754  ORF Transcript_5801/g.7754 Transcript_5801/m.7754 type:complete len:111 (+) Transcript_5801:762-1094(+)
MHADLDSMYESWQRQPQALSCSASSCRRASAKVLYRKSLLFAQPVACIRFVLDIPLCELKVGLDLTDEARPDDVLRQQRHQCAQLIGQVISSQSSQSCGGGAKKKKKNSL